MKIFLHIMKNLYQRALSVAIWLFIVLLTFVLAIVPFFLDYISVYLDRNRKIPHVIGMIWARIILLVNPLWKIKIIGMEKIKKNNAYIFVSNHQGMGDVIAIFHLNTHFKWIGKESAFKVPLMGKIMKDAGYISLRRGDKDSGKECIQKAKDWLKKGMSIYLFPEGTRSIDGTIGEFKAGAFKLAIETGIPIVPITIEGSNDVLPKNEWIFRHKSKMQVKVDNPIDVKNYTLEKLDELRDYTKAVIQKNYNELKNNIHS